MKTGKYITLGEYNDVKIGYGTVDYKNLKSIYLKLNSWLEPKDYSDFDSIVRKTRKKIIEHIYDKRYPLFEKQSLVDLDVRTKGVKTDKRSFMNLEVTLFVKQYFDVKSKENKKIIKDIITNIIDENLTDDTLFNFNMKKDDTTRQIKVKTKV